MKKINLFAAVAMTMIVASSCSNSDKTSNGNADTNALSTDSLTPYDSATTVAHPADTASSTPMAFALNAGAGGLTEVEMGNLAKISGNNSRVKGYGIMLVNDHTKANKELMAIAQTKNINVPTTLPTEKQMHINEMKALNTEEFDKKFMDMMVKDHNETINLFEEASKHSVDQEIKAFATKTLPVLKMHLDSAKAIRKALK